MAFVLKERGGYARGGGGSGLSEASNRVTSGRVPASVVATTATAVVPGVRTAAGPNSDASVAASVSVVLRHEHETEEAGFERCIGHCCASLWEQARACWTAQDLSCAHSDTGTSTAADAWQRSHAPTIQAKCCRNLRIAA